MDVACCGYGGHGGAEDGSQPATRSLNAHTVEQKWHNHSSELIQLSMQRTLIPYHDNPDAQRAASDPWIVIMNDYGCVGYSRICT